MAKCDPNEAIPRTCAEAFREIGERLTRIEATSRGIHEQTLRMNGRVAELFHRTSRHDTEIELLRADVNQAARGRSIWCRRIWQLVVGLALLLAGYFLRS